MEINNGNYYSIEADIEYLSTTQYKKFLNYKNGGNGCEASALAELKGMYSPDNKESYLIGNYLHSYFSGDMEEFKKNNISIFSTKGTTKGELKAGYKNADDMISVIENDDKCMFYLSNCESEVPLIGEIDGIKWKGKADKINNELNYILDLKTTKSINEFTWSTKHNKRVSFIEQYDYFIQVAVYSELERQLRNDDLWKEFYVLAVSKEKYPDHALIDCTDYDRVRIELEKIKENQKRIVAIKKGEIKPERCENCAYCRQTKKVDKLIFYNDLRE